MWTKGFLMCLATAAAGALTAWAGGLGAVGIGIYAGAHANEDLFVFRTLHGGSWHADDQPDSTKHDIGREVVDGRDSLVRSARQLLGVPAGAAPGAVDAAYRRLCEQYPLDGLSGMAPELKALAARRRKEIDAAYQVLKEPRT